MQYDRTVRSQTCEYDLERAKGGQRGMTGGRLPEERTTASRRKITIALRWPMIIQGRHSCRSNQAGLAAARFLWREYFRELADF
jgi:hypothetical protein